MFTLAKFSEMYQWLILQDSDVFGIGLASS